MSAAIDSLPDPVLSPNLIYEDRRKVKQVLSEYVLQQDGSVAPVKQILPLNRGNAIWVNNVSTAIDSLYASAEPRGVFLTSLMLNFYHPRIISSRRRSVCLS